MIYFISIVTNLRGKNMRSGYLLLAQIVLLSIMPGLTRIISKDHDCCVPGKKNSNTGQVLKGDVQATWEK
jgi:hypothetical protein